MLPLSTMMARRGTPCPCKLTLRNWRPCGDGQAAVPGQARGSGSVHRGIAAASLAAACTHPLAALAAATPVAAIAEAAGGQGISGALQGVLEQASSLGPAGDILFIGTYALATTLFIPASVLTLGAGGVYGVVHGTALVSAASTLGCTLAFVISRYVARPFAEEQLRGNDLFERLEKKIPERGAKLVFLLRLTPLVPFSLLNYMCGLTSLALPEYVAASWAGMLPGTLAYVYLGAAGTDTISAVGGSGLSLQTALQAVGAIAAILLVREASKLAQEAVGDDIDGA